MTTTISFEAKERLLSKAGTFRDSLLKSDNYTQEQIDAINDIINLLEEMELDE